ncbi:unnamed protein product, partial [Polarella glacialis]
AMGASSSAPMAKPGSSPGANEVRLAATEIVRIAGMGGYHTSVIVGDTEYFFDSVGIMEAPALWSHLAGDAKTGTDVKTEVTVIGTSHLSGRTMAQVLKPFFEKGSYDIFYKNCNTFSDAALYYLTNARLSSQYNRIERLVTATDPVSVSLLNRLVKAMMEKNTDGTVTGDVYVTNPEAEGFSVSDVIATLEADAEESDTEEPDEASESDTDDEFQGCGGGRLERTGCK